MTGITVSALIPTLGRDTLQRTVDSILAQRHPVHEIVVANDSPSQQPLFDRDSIGGVRLVEVLTGGRTGIGNGRNLGIRAASGSHIAYVDDDDIWLPHHIARAVDTLTRRPELAVYACSTVLAHPDAARIAPKVRYSGRRSLLDHYYGPWSWAGREKAITPSTWVFRRELGLAFPMDTTLPDKEDVWWLLQVGRAGHRVWQSSVPGVVYFEDPARTRSRERLDTELAWAKRLDTLHAKAGTHFLVHTAGRRLARAGDRRGWRELMAATQRDFPLDAGHRAVRALEGALLTVRGKDRTGGDAQ